MRRLPDVDQKIRAERQVSIFIGAGLDPKEAGETGSFWASEIAPANLDAHWPSFSVTQK